MRKVPIMKNWFEGGGRAYARFRPEYPADLSRFLAGIAPATDFAVDVGCGNGQLTEQLAQHFSRVLGLDPSADQIANAPLSSKSSYACASAERIPVDDGFASLITAAQAAHWFDLPRFYREVRRIAAPNAALCLVSYGVLRLEDELNERFSCFYRKEIGAFWPAERKLVDNGYRDLSFPFAERTVPEMAIRKEWTLDELLGYISTWSAVLRVREAGQEEILRAFASELTKLWGDLSRRRTVLWPLNMRLGTL